MLSGRGLWDELITRQEESYRLWCVVVCDLETSRMGAPYIYIYIYDISSLRVKVRDALYRYSVCVMQYEEQQSLWIEEEKGAERGVGGGDINRADL